MIKNYTSQPDFKREIVTQKSSSQKEFNDKNEKARNTLKNLFRRT